MNLYLISQEKNNWYDTYDSAVVCAETEEQARMIHPDEKKDWDGKRKEWGTWCDAKQVMVELIGVAAPRTEAGSVICASFNAG